nr:FUSC family protein [Providencia burhodogranariea]
MKLNWMFAIKYMLAIILAWYVSSYFGFDKPYWSMMTVAIIGYPDLSLSLAKMGARLAGSLIGVIAVTLIANVSINDQWLFTSLIITWLSTCLFLTLVSRYMMQYMFSLSGYTSAIIAFGTSVYPLPMTIFKLSEERLMEVTIGIVAYTFVMYVLPSKRNPFQSKLLKNKIKMDKKLALSELFKGHKDNTVKYIKDIITTSVAYDELSQYESNFISFKKTSSQVLKLPMFITFIMLGLSDKGMLKYKGYNQFISIKNKLDRGNDSNCYYFFDWRDACLNTMRLVLSLIISVVFWFNTGWDYGYILAVLVSISFTFGITIPKANKLAFIIFIVALFVIAVSYLLKFYFLIQVSSFSQALLIMIPVFLLLGVLKTIGKLSFLISHVICISIIFLINFTNPMVFDFVSFSNTAIALLFSIIIVILMLYIIPLSSAEQIEKRRVNFIFVKVKVFLDKGNEISKLKNTIIMNLNSFSKTKNLNILYVLLSLLNIYELSKDKEVKEILIGIITQVLEGHDRVKILSSLESKNSKIQDVNISYTKSILSFLPWF